MARWVRLAILGFVAGAVGVLVFHQGGFWLSKVLGILNANPWSVRPVPPWAVPTIVSQCFWGGLWGAVGANVIYRLRAPLNGWLGWALFAGVIVTLANWFIVAPLKGAPIGFGFRAPGVYVAVVVYAVWGVGMWLIASALSRVTNWK